MIEGSVLTNVSIGLGGLIAILISWSLNKSIFWAIFHGICGWLYVIYYVSGPKENDSLK